MGIVVYTLDKLICYTSARYDKRVIVRKGYQSDGATGARDIDSRGWWVHDMLCDTGVFYDGTPCTNWQASMVLHDILISEGYWFRARSWFMATWLMGGGEARKNGMW